METNQFDEMAVYDFSNLDLGQDGNDNCFSCDHCDGCDSGGCDGKW